MHRSKRISFEIQQKHNNCESQLAENMDIFVVAKSRLRFLGLIHRKQPLGQFINIMYIAVGLFLTFSLFSLSCISILFDSENFAAKNEAGQAFIIGATNFPFYTLFLLNRTQMFDLFKILETKIAERMLDCGFLFKCIVIRYRLLPIK